MRTRPTTAIAGLVLLAAAAALAAGTTAPAPKKAAPAGPAKVSAAVPIARAERITIRSVVLGEDRELRIAKPADYDRSDATYPVLYVLDAETAFPVTSEVVRFLSAYSLIPGMIVVGVVNTDRARDMTPNRAVPPHERYATAGGADRFLRFLREEAIPLVEKAYRGKPSPAILGHSLSGLLVVHALVAGPDLFSDYIAVSPSLWWNDYESYAKVRALYASRPSLPKRAWISLADESESEPERYDQLREAFEASAPKDFAVTVRFFKQDNHITTAVTSTMNALMSLYANPGAKPAIRARSRP